MQETSIDSLHEQLFAMKTLSIFYAHTKYEILIFYLNAEIKS